MRLVFILISTSFFMLGVQAEENDVLSLFLKSLEKAVVKELNTDYPYCVSDSVEQRWRCESTCAFYVSKAASESAVNPIVCPATQSFDWNICDCSKEAIDQDTCTSAPDGLSLGTCKVSGSSDEFAVSRGCKNSYRKYRTGWLIKPCADGELFNLDECECQESASVNTATCRTAGLILDCSPNDMPGTPDPPITNYPWCVDDKGDQRKVNATVAGGGCEKFEMYKKDGEKCKGTCKQGMAFDWNVCECISEDQVDRTRCTGPPDGLHLGTCTQGGSGDYTPALGCHSFYQKLGTGWLKQTCAANLLFDLDRCTCSTNVDAETCRTKRSNFEIRELELAAKISKLLHF